MAGWNLGLRFGLELGSLVGLGAAAWMLTSGRARPVAVLAVPVGAPVVWGSFNVLDDPSRSGAAPIAVPGSARLAIELLILGGGAAAVLVDGRPKTAVCFSALIAAHYATWGVHRSIQKSSVARRSSCSARQTGRDVGSQRASASRTARCTRGGRRWYGPSSGHGCGRPSRSSPSARRSAGRRSR